LLNIAAAAHGQQQITCDIFSTKMLYPPICLRTASIHIGKTSAFKASASSDHHPTSASTSISAVQAVSNYS